MKRKISWGVLAVIAAVFAIYFTVARRPVPSETRPIASTPSPAATSLEKVEMAREIAPHAGRPRWTERRPKLSAADDATLRRAQITNGIDRSYGKAMQGLGLTSEEIGILRNFLITRAEVGLIAQDVVTERPDAAGRDVLIAADAARAEVDEEIRKYFGDEKFSRIQQMREASAYFGVEKRDLAPALEKAGVPQLSPDQLLQFGAAMAEANGKGIKVIRPTWTDPETGLTNRDVPVLEKALEFLSPEQVAVLKTVLAARNRNQ